MKMIKIQHKEYMSRIAGAVILLLALATMTSVFTTTASAGDFQDTDGKPTIFEEDFEGSSDWTTTGLWHRVTENDQYGDSYSGSQAMWYGQDSTGDYDTGSRTNGSLVLSSIDLSFTASPELIFYHWFETENYQDGHYDKVKVLINGEQVYYKDTTDGNVGSENSFVKESINLSDYIGEDITVRFVFDSIDHHNNGYRGWYVDNVQVKGYSTGFNLPPEAHFNYTPEVPNVGEEVEFIDQSHDTNKNIVRWIWDLGDGTTSNEQNPTHTYSSGGTYTVELRVVDAGDSTDTVTKEIQIQEDMGGDEEIYSEDFEGSSDWTTSGLWHVVDDPEEYGDAQSGSHSMWYGQDSTGDYDTGSRTTGKLGSPTIDLSGVSEAKLTFHHWYETENYDGNYEQMRVLVNGETVYYRNSSDANVGSENDFVKETIDLSDYAGQTVQIEFEFDSMDDYNNDHRGWYVDDIVVEEGAPESTNEAVKDVEVQSAPLNSQEHGDRTDSTNGEKEAQDAPEEEALGSITGRIKPTLLSVQVLYLLAFVVAIIGFVGMYAWKGKRGNTRY